MVPYCPGDLDDAVLDRMDEALEFGLPDVPERQRLLELYLDKYIAKAGTEAGGAGAGGAGGALARLTSLMKGRKVRWREKQSPLSSRIPQMIGRGRGGDVERTRSMHPKQRRAAEGGAV